MFAIAIVVVVIANLFAATDAQLSSEQIEKLNREIDRIWEEDDDDDGDSGFLMVVGGCAGGAFVCFFGCYWLDRVCLRPGRLRRFEQRQRELREPEEPAGSVAAPTNRTAETVLTPTAVPTNTTTETVLPAPLLPTSTPVLTMAKALHPYAPTAPNQIAMAQDERFTLLDSAGSWWKVKAANGTEGLVPSNYIEKVADNVSSDA